MELREDRKTQNWNLRGASRKKTNFRSTRRKRKSFRSAYRKRSFRETCLRRKRWIREEKWVTVKTVESKILTREICENRKSPERGTRILNFQTSVNEQRTEWQNKCHWKSKPREQRNAWRAASQFPQESRRNQLVFKGELRHLEWWKRENYR